jgi:hypothetical protein
MPAQPPTQLQPPAGTSSYPWQQLPPTTKAWEVGPIAGSPFPRPTFPAGSFLDGFAQN